MTIKTITPDTIATDAYAHITVYADKKLSDAKAIKAAHKAVRDRGLIADRLAVLDRSSDRSAMVSLLIRRAR